MSEFMAAVALYFNESKLAPTAGAVDAIFGRFMADVITPRRPFYLHTCVFVFCVRV